jgi:hypothetical protein
MKLGLPPNAGGYARPTSVRRDASPTCLARCLRVSIRAARYAHRAATEGCLAASSVPHCSEYAVQTSEKPSHGSGVENAAIPGPTRLECRSTIRNSGGVPHFLQRGAAAHEPRLGCAGDAGRGIRAVGAIASGGRW